MTGGGREMLGTVKESMKTGDIEEGGKGMVGKEENGQD
jgi:hypothetical protein